MQWKKLWAVLKVIAENAPLVIQMIQQAKEKK